MLRDTWGRITLVRSLKVAKLSYGHLCRFDSEFQKHCQDFLQWHEMSYGERRRSCRPFSFPIESFGLGHSAEPCGGRQLRRQACPATEVVKGDLLSMTIGDTVAADALVVQFRVVSRVTE